MAMIEAIKSTDERQSGYLRKDAQVMKYTKELGTNIAIDPMRVSKRMRSLGSEDRLLTKSRAFRKVFTAILSEVPVDLIDQLVTAIFRICWLAD